MSDRLDVVSSEPMERFVHRGTVAALVTPPGRSAIATVMVHGADALRAVAEFCDIDRSDLSWAAEAQRLRVRTWNGCTSERIVIRARDQHRIEIHCHGGLIPSSTILADLATIGIPTVPWQEMNRREARSMIELEVLEALTRAPTPRTAAVLLDQYHGALEHSITELIRLLADRRDDEAAAGIARLLDYGELGAHLVSPWRVVLLGRPNAGKSSLFNAILGFDRAIVHPTPGTTRDIVSAVSAIEGWPVELLDTAGIRASNDELEVAGIERTRNAIADSDCQVFVFDGSEPLNAADLRLLSSCQRPVFVANKADLPSFGSNASTFKHGIATSCRTGEGIDRLLNRLASSLVTNTPKPGEAVPFTARQLDGLRRAIDCLPRCPDSSLNHLIQVVSKESQTLKDFRDVDKRR